MEDKMLLKIPLSIFDRKILNHTFFAANGMILIYSFHFWDQAHLNTLISLIRLTLENYDHTLTLHSSNFLNLKPGTASAASNKSTATKKNLLLDFSVQ